MTSDELCEHEQELPLLLYGDSGPPASVEDRPAKAGRGGGGELDDAARADLESHVAACRACARALAELRATTRALDAAPLLRPSPEKWAALKSNVLARVASNAEMQGECASIEQSIAIGVRSSDVIAHLERCDRCRDADRAFAATFAALDAIPLERPSAEKWSALKTNVLARVREPALVGSGSLRPEHSTANDPITAPDEPAFTEIGLPVQISSGASHNRSRAVRLFARAAAAALIFALGIAASRTVARGPSAEQIRALKAEGDTRLVARDLGLAMVSYQGVVRDAAGRPEVAAEFQASLTELLALERYNAANGQRDASVRVKELERLVVIHPESRVAIYAIQDLAVLKPDMPVPPQDPNLGPNEAQIFIRSPVTERRNLTVLNASELRASWERTVAELREHSRDANARATASLHLGKLAEEAGDVAAARKHYESAVADGAGSPAALRAQERLERLPPPK